MVTQPAFLGCCTQEVVDKIHEWLIENIHHQKPCQHDLKIEEKHKIKVDNKNN